MTRARRRLVAWLGILGIAFAQLAVTAHACVMRTAVPTSPAMGAVAHGDHCAGATQATAPVAPPGNACEVQCTEGAPVAAPLDLPPVTLAPFPATPALPELAVDSRERDRSILAADAAGPPRRLQFLRFLN